MKLFRNKLILIPTIIIVLLSTYGLLFYFNFFQKSININEGKISTSNIVDNNFKSCYSSSINFNDIEPSKISNDITINILSKQIISNDIYEKSLRYYLPLDLICSSLNYTTTNTGDLINIQNESNTITFGDTENCLVNGQAYSMRGNLLKINNKSYIALSDIEYLFNLTAVFNFETKEISFLDKLPNYNIGDTSTPVSGRAALLRLEDFSAGYGTLNSENQLKYKCIGNLLKSNNIKFHIAWVPRFISPSDNIDNNLLDNDTLENIGFINTLDYLINSGASIGLHGYSHQTGDSTSLVGVELSYNSNSSEEETRKVIENAIDTAASLNIPYNFFESPHYKATKKQKEIIEQYFQFLYEPKNIFIYNKLEKHNNNLYIPTPLSYVQNNDTTSIEKYLKSPLPGQLASLFYHPALELDFINVNISNSTINIDYDTTSPLYKIVYSLKDNSYVPIYITDFNK